MTHTRSFIRTPDGAAPQTRVSRRTFGRVLAGMTAASIGLSTGARVSLAADPEPQILDDRLEPSVASLSTQSDTVAQTAQTAQTAASTTSYGDSIAAFAYSYVGYPYVYAGNTPAGFDCSGFTQYVYLNTLGIDIGHSTEGQAGAGYAVEYGAWMPGDLLLFAGTYGDGISHAAIYVGDGAMVHAENESTGVCVGNVYSDYYTAHYYTARRLI